MNSDLEYSLGALERFALQPAAVYSIDAAAHAAGVPRHLILVCCKHGLLSPQMDPVYGGYYFAEGDLRRLERIRYLQFDCGINLTGIKIIFGLMDEADRLQARLTDS
ncbi:MAG: hypothetical protein RIQ93_111 [Verrucomicrobiota bacterium]|jgi:DNA-binding transcriptional MerR regulator